MQPARPPGKGPATRNLLLAFVAILLGSVAIVWKSSLTANLAVLPYSGQRRVLNDANCPTLVQPSTNSSVQPDVNTTVQPALRSSWALDQSWFAPKYSTYTCIGQKFDDIWQQASCKFTDICLNGSSLQFEYYVNPDYPDTPVAYDQKGKPYLKKFPARLVNSGHGRIDAQSGWAPKLVKRPFPEGPQVKWAPSQHAILGAIPTSLLENFGHAMFDVLVPMFNLEHLFGLYTPAAQILILGPQGAGSEEDLRKELPRMINPPDPAMSVLRLTWDRDAEFLEDYARHVLGESREGLVCFRTALAGTGYLNRQMDRVDALPYRQAVVEKIGLLEEPQEQPVITMLVKKGRRMIENWEEIVDVLRKRYPAARVDTFDFGDHPDITMPEQVKLMSDTSILLSPCGGLATVLTFLRPGATAIVMNYWQTHRDRSIHMEDIYYKNIEYLDLQYFPVTLKDYEGTWDRPDCELVEGGSRGQDAHYHLLGKLVHCNVRLQGDSMQRLVDYADNAMRAWAARTGRFEVLDGISKAAAEGTEGAAQSEPAANAELVAQPAAVYGVAATER